MSDLSGPTGLRGLARTGPVLAIGAVVAVVTVGLGLTTVVATAFRPDRPVVEPLVIDETPNGSDGPADPATGSGAGDGPEPSSTDDRTDDRDPVHSRPSQRPPGDGTEATGSEATSSLVTAPPPPPIASEPVRTTASSDPDTDGDGEPDGGAEPDPDPDTDGPDDPEPDLDGGGDPDDDDDDDGGE